MEERFKNLIDTLTFKECLTVLAVCAPDVLEIVGDDLMNDPDKDAAVIRARKIVNNIRKKQEKEDLDK